MTEAREARLVGDFGATHARLGLSGRRGRLQLERSYLCAGFSGLTEVIRHYYSDIGLATAEQPRQAALAIAAPLLSDTVRMTNLDWSFSAAATRRELGLQRLRLLNDFTALALALPRLLPSQRRQVGGGMPVARSVVGLIGAGSGLGVSGLVPAGDGWVALGTEGGHTSFSPRDERELDILRYAMAQHPHVSFERLVSGPGLELSYLALLHRAGRPAHALPAPEITRRALEGSDAVCLQALETF